MPENLDLIRNIGIIAHIDAGKTSTSENMLFFSGQIHRVGSIDDGTTVLDFLDEERSRGITIIAAAATFSWNGAMIHLIDTPGHIDFTAEVERSMRVIDGAVVIFSGVEGVEGEVCQDCGDCCSRLCSFRIGWVWHSKCPVLLQPGPSRTHRE